MRSKISYECLELVFGDILGYGTFGVVREVTEIRVGEEAKLGHDIAGAETDKMLESLPSFPLSDIPSDVHRECEATSPSTTQPLGKHDSFNPTISLSRHHMSVRCIRGGVARYAVKQLLLEDATERESDSARIDLAIEVNYLQVLSHPHVIKLRGLFQTDDPFHPAYFFVMDRLYGTLEDKISEWAKRSQSRWKGMFSCFQKNAMLIEDDFVIQRLLVAYDIASAFDYMHRNNVVHR